MKIETGERRSVSRIPFEVDVKIILEDKNFNSTLSGKSKNITEYGMGLITSRNFKKDEEFKILFSIGTHKITVECKTIWCKQIGFSELYDVGAKFIDMNDKHREFLICAVRTARIMNKPLK